MKLVISQTALNWFKEEMDAEPSSSIKFFARYGGSNPFHEGYSIGVTFDEPIEEAVTFDVDGIHFFIERDDLWFFNDHDLHVDVNTDLEELIYDYVKN